jgi:hypothetical protein
MEKKKTTVDKIREESFINSKYAFPVGFTLAFVLIGSTCPAIP